MREYALHQTATLVDRLAAQLHQAAEGDADAIHDVRVATRRLSRCLRLFATFYPDHSWKKLRRQLSALMAAAGAVRDCDIALELLADAGVSPRAAVMVRLRSERAKNGEDLVAEVKRWKRRELLRKWTKRLEV